MKRAAPMWIAAVVVAGTVLGVVAHRRYALARDFARAERCRRELFTLSVLVREHVVTTGSLPGTGKASGGASVDPVALWRDLGSQLMPGDRRLFQSFSVRDGAPVDPWGRAYWFRIQDRQGRAARILLILGSSGPDGIDGSGTGDDTARTVEHGPVPRAQESPPTSGLAPAF